MAHPDLDELLNTLLPFAQQQLVKRGGFLPFGATLSADGEIALAAGYTEDKSPTPQTVLELMQAGFAAQARRGEIRAVGVCVDSRVVPPGGTDKTDAICCSLEHASGEAVDVFVPYRRGLLGRLKFGEIFASAGQAKTFNA